MNKTRYAALAGLVSLCLSVPLAAHAGAQQDKMKACNAEAKEKNLQGDERKAFMKDCLSAKKKEEVDKKTAQQEKMKTCNKDAKEKNLSGDARKKFMSDCLKG
ncbi:MAG: phosphate starvation-inducible protein PsiF [Rhodocyclaceae bacterium]|nr:phosphate starvation-inducible protein PsiF [Rhodocyclaceae bacterium]MBX3668735.1 phosphate starvation-inducible protein PsiF [Rhodocyclaceae bacterium]